MRWCGASDMPRAGASWHIQIESSILASPVPFPSEELLLLQAQLSSAQLVLLVQADLEERKNSLSWFATDRPLSSRRGRSCLIL